MINPVQLMDIFTAAVVAIGLTMGGAGLVVKNWIIPQEDKNLVAHCLPTVNERTIENETCSQTDIASAYQIRTRIENANSLALGGLFTMFAGGMIGGTAGYARAYQGRMEKYVIK